MTKPDRKNYEEYGDAELASLFASMDGITASEELKASTLSAIFEQADAGEPPVTPESAADSADATMLLGKHAKEAPVSVASPGKTTVPPKQPTGTRSQPTDDGAASAAPVESTALLERAAEAQPTFETGSAGATAQLQTPTGTQNEMLVDKTSKRAPLVDISEADRGESRQPTKAKSSKKHAAWRLKIAAAVVAVAIVVGGGVAYALPANHVLVSVDETTFDLGVNVFGTTVSVASNSEEGEAVLKTSDVHNIGFRDALDRLLDAYEKNRGSAPDDFAVKVNKGFGDGGDGLTREANRVFEQRRESRPQQTQSVEQQPQESWREQQPQQAPSVEQPQEQPLGDQGGRQDFAQQEPAVQEPQGNQGGGQQPSSQQREQGQQPSEQQQEPGQQPSGQQQEPAQREPAQQQMVEGGQADGAAQGAGNQQPQGAGQPAR